MDTITMIPASFLYTANDTGAEHLVAAPAQEHCAFTGTRSFSRSASNGVTLEQARQRDEVHGARA